MSGEEGVKRNRIISGVCLFILVAFSVYLLFPSFFADYTLATETYVLMAVWSLVGIVYFHFVIRNDGSVDDLRAGVRAFAETIREFNTRGEKNGIIRNMLKGVE